MASRKLKSKTPTKKKTVWLELILFCSLGLFGFSLATFLLSGGTIDSISVTLDPFTSNTTESEEAVVAVLYEAESTRPIARQTLAPIFTPSVMYWEEDILRWTEPWGIDPNLAATVMQIESCGYPQALSRSGAMSLFQVMPFHFTQGEDPYNPDTNAYRGMSYLARGLEISDGHAGLAMAGYNGGHSVINRNYNAWADETKRYYRWGSGIYREASAGWESSPTLAAWQAAAGGLCGQAENYLGI